MNYLRRMFSSSNETSWGRSAATVVLAYIMLANSYMLFSFDLKEFPKIDEFWQNVILLCFGISKTGETIQKFAERRRDATETPKT